MSEVQNVTRNPIPLHVRVSRAAQIDRRTARIWLTGMPSRPSPVIGRVIVDALKALGEPVPAHLHWLLPAGSSKDGAQ